MKFQYGIGRRLSFKLCDTFKFKYMYLIVYLCAAAPWYDQVDTFMPRVPLILPNIKLMNTIWYQIKDQNIWMRGVDVAQGG